MGTWTPYETGVLMELVGVYGRAWNTISNKMRVRLRRKVTASSIRNRVLRTGSRGDAKRKQRCAACGELRRGHMCKGRVEAAPVMKPVSLEDYEVLFTRYKLHQESCVVSVPSVLREMGFDDASVSRAKSWAPVWAR